jgi:prepilin-type N-terminal cleavage/methylation domain-containing protein
MDSATPLRPDERGFTLLEVLVAMAIMIVGLLSLAYGIGLGLEGVQMSTMDTIAREKAREAMEDVFTARDTSTISFSQICNIPASGSNSNNCLFVTGYTPMYTADSLGLVNTNAAANNAVETFLVPGPSGVLGGTDQPAALTLSGFQRQITVTPISSPDGHETLAIVEVDIFYKPLPWQSRYVTMITVMSAYV